MIEIRQIEKNELSIYDTIPMRFLVKSELKVSKLQNGLGGLEFSETPVEPYTKDLGKYMIAEELPSKFDTSNWAFFVAFENNHPIAGAILVCKTKEINMLSGRDDLGVLWDIRVSEEHKRKGIGQLLFARIISWSKDRGLSQLKIESQNNNVAACKFYKKNGANLGEYNEYAYFNDSEVSNEIQLIWYVDL